MLDPFSTNFRYDNRSVARASNETNELVGSDMTKLCGAGGSALPSITPVYVVREKPTFIAALRISISNLVGLGSSGSDYTGRLIATLGE